MPEADFQNHFISYTLTNFYKLYMIFVFFNNKKIHSSKTYLANVSN